MFTFCKIFAILTAVLTNAPIVKWISRKSTELLFQVRALMGAPKNSALLLNFLLLKKKMQNLSFCIFAWFINFYFTSNVKVMSPEPNAWLSERHHWKLSLSKRPITNV